MVYISSLCKETIVIRHRVGHSSLHIYAYLKNAWSNISYLILLFIWRNTQKCVTVFNFSHSIFSTHLCFGIHTLLFKYIYFVRECTKGAKLLTWAEKLNKLFTVMSLFWMSKQKTTKQFIYTTCFELEVFMYNWTVKSMNNLLSYRGLVDARMSASKKDLPVL